MHAWFAMTAGILLIGCQMPASARVVHSTNTLVENIRSADRYLFGYVRWASVGAFGYGKPFVFNYEIKQPDGRAIQVCSLFPFQVGQNVLLVMKAHEEESPKGCASQSLFIPPERFDTFLYPSFRGVDEGADWIAIPSEEVIEVGCKVRSRDFDIAVTDAAKKAITQDPYVLPARHFINWQDLKKCL